MRPEIVQSENFNQRLELLGPGKPGKTHGLMGTGRRFAWKHAADVFFAWVWTETKKISQSGPEPLPGYPDSFPILCVQFIVTTVTLCMMLLSIYGYLVYAVNLYILSPGVFCYSVNAITK
jgi:hypothetical protein